ncbi:MAG: DUF1016 domain-containing protein [Symploca sp. SIO1B1]|nr:DUF1016 domain-containing protein [Symploca sp. SIO1B1]
MLNEVVELMETSRRQASRSINSIMTATYWEIGRRIVEFEQLGESRAEYGKQLISRLAHDLSTRFGRGFSKRNLEQMRRFYLLWSITQTPSAQSQVPDFKQKFPLPWSHYIQLLSVKSNEARAFYEEQALQGGWSVRQLRRQISTQFYERTLLSRNKAAMLEKGTQSLPSDTISPEEEIKDPVVLEFLALKDEYSESDLEEALIQHIESFLLEYGKNTPLKPLSSKASTHLNEKYRVSAICRGASIKSKKMRSKPDMAILWQDSQPTIGCNLNISVKFRKMSKRLTQKTQFTIKRLRQAIDSAVCCLS